MVIHGSRRRIVVAAMGFVLALAATPLVANAADAESSNLYVSRHHSTDANPCTAHKPCRTIGYAVGVAPVGATIHVGRGKYAEQVSITKRLTLKGEHAVIDATGQTVTAGTSSGANPKADRPGRERSLMSAPSPVEGSCRRIGAPIMKAPRRTRRRTGRSHHANASP